MKEENTNPTGDFEGILSEVINHDPDNPIMGFMQLPDGTSIIVDAKLVQEALTTNFTYFRPDGRASGRHIISDGTGDSAGEVAIRGALPEGFELQQYLESYIRDLDASRITFAAFEASGEGVIGGGYDSIEEAVEAAKAGHNTLEPEDAAEVAQTEQNLEA